MCPPGWRLSMRTILILAATGGVALAGIELANTESLKEDERVLKEAGITVEGAGLLDFFRRQTLSEAEYKKLQAAVRLLGNEVYAVRQAAAQSLIRAGRPALALLRPALTDPDRE